MSLIAAVSAVERQAEQLRRDGNTYFQKERFAAAIDAFTEAIVLCPDIPIYWTNRALCHRKRNDWTRVEEDCRRAIELDDNSVKALDLGRGAEPECSMVEEIQQELAKAKYSEWEHQSAQHSLELQTLKDACEVALRERLAANVSQIEGYIDDAIESHEKQLLSLDWVFRKAAEEDIPEEVPDYLCCKITLSIFHDPVITPSGLTYEREVILDHLEKVGNFDPTTREPLDQDQLIPNVAVKEAVQAYLDKHGWAYKTD